MIFYLVEFQESLPLSALYRAIDQNKQFPGAIIVFIPYHTTLIIILEINNRPL